MFYEDARRSFSKRAPVGLKSAAADMFFHELYISAAEPLPLGPKAKKSGSRTRSRQLSHSEADVFHDDEPWLKAGEPVDGEASGEDQHPNWDPDAFTVQSLTAFTVGCSSRVVGVPRRYLPPSQLHDLYWIFIGWYDRQFKLGAVPTDVPTSYKHFQRRYKQMWSKCLKIRDHSNFTQCTTCWELQKTMNSKTSWDAKVTAARNLRQHYLDQ